jgi:hypothetical protein
MTIPIRHRAVIHGKRPVTREEWRTTHRDSKGRDDTGLRRIVAAGHVGDSVSYPVIIVQADQIADERGAS